MNCLTTALKSVRVPATSERWQPCYPRRIMRKMSARPEEETIVLPLLLFRLVLDKSSQKTISRVDHPNAVVSKSKDAMVSSTSILASLKLCNPSPSKKKTTNKHLTTICLKANICTLCSTVLCRRRRSRGQGWEVLLFYPPYLIPYTFCICTCVGVPVLSTSPRRPTSYFDSASSPSTESRLGCVYARYHARGVCRRMCVRSATRE
ncbi:hypothetical protein M378DRAFT_1055486 [Amanita muscaria Koide BX008]|uniref:Uncharacterized protein n=1 Tax=Amanita muscaria (strain Koide BX008) TaxID=946122 RepID=A0A0C2T713_AMAMK|nr:hypothetical protein M378DRAFT_1055486 [Amanita muscaria Koide BX008]